MIRKTFLAIGVSLTLVTGIYQTALAQEAVLEEKSAGTSTMPQDELCIMANGNRIPCVFLEAAEKDVSTGGKVVDQVNGKEYCKANDRYVSCDTINADGSATLSSRLEQYTNIMIFVLAKYWLYIVSILGVALISSVVSRKLSKK